MLDPQIYFTGQRLEKHFLSHLLGKKGGGIDNLSPQKFYELNHDKFEEIAERCLSGKYHFSCYRERLELKGAGKAPRILSIPSMRDRLVLGELNEYLQDTFRKKGYSQTIPNMEIKRLKEFFRNHPKDKKIKFLKTDFHDYYGSINRELLHEKLAIDINPVVLDLINKAIAMPTIPHGTNSKDALPKEKGIPQGLSISNILAYVYLKDFDDNVGKVGADLYIRYVDDMLFLNPKHDNMLTYLKDEISNKNLGLAFSEGKVKEGTVEDDSLDFIGYHIGHDRKISAIKKNATNFITRLAGLTKKCLEGATDKNKRYIFCKDDDKFEKFFISEFNLRLGGFRNGNHNYGWIAYYQGIDDVSLLYAMDRVIKKRIMKRLPDTIKSKLYSLVDVYYDILDNKGSKYVIDFDAIVRVNDIRNYLNDKGYETNNLSERDLRILFRQYKSNLIRQMELSIGRIS